MIFPVPEKQCLLYYWYYFYTVHSLLEDSMCGHPTYDHKPIQKLAKIAGICLFTANESVITAAKAARELVES